MMLTVVEVAARLKVSRTCVYQLVDSRKLVSCRIGLGRGTIRISEEDLTAFIDSCRAVKTAGASLPERPVQLKHLTQ